MKPIFIALLHNLKVIEGLGSGDKIGDALRITNDVSKVANLLTPAHRQLIGELECSALLTGAPVVFGEGDATSNFSPQEQLLARLYEVQRFLMTSWIIEDNAINCEIGFLLYMQNNVAFATSNFIAHLYSTARGEKPVTTISRERLREMRRLYREAIHPPDHPFLRPTSQLTSAHPRAPRAMLLVNAARGTSDISLKVAHYCSAFEALFATSQTELAHQLSERIACYLHRRSEGRLAAYRRIKTAYALRSKVVHRAALRKEKVSEAVDIASYCDQVARQLFWRLFTEQRAQSLFEKRSESFDEEMLKVIFGNTN